MAKVQRTIGPGQRIRVLIVDDSVVIRQLVTHALESDPALEVAGVAANGSIALAKIAQLNPDAVTLDIEMPEMNGLETLRRIRREYPHLRVIMFSTLTERGASATLEALALGADDYVAKASNEGSLDRSLARLREELIPKIKQFFAVQSAPTRAPALAMPLAPPARRLATPSIVAIGVSTGGPAALSKIIPQFPADFAVPILIVQHMPPLFTKLLADRLNDSTPLRVREAVEGAIVRPGDIWIAPGDFHMSAILRGKELRLRLDQGPPENSCRPAVDVLFASVAAAFGEKVVAVVLTGMGRDGQCGAAQLKARGSSVIVQDEASSVVWGMPGSVVHEGLADAVLPLDEIPAEVIRRVTGHGGVRPRASHLSAPSSTGAGAGRTKEATCPH
ncbi:MAG TPA: chemotaxis response regulator protein-glutamate methylesterase [Bryobacteraceae bacterium]